MERITLPTQTRRQYMYVKQQFLLTRETSETWVTKIVEADKVQMGDILAAFYQLLTQLQLAHIHMSSTKPMVYLYQVADVLQGDIYTQNIDNLKSTKAKKKPPKK